VTLLHALVDLLVAFVLPGWLFLRAVGWPRSQPERLLMAGPASIALIAVLTALLGRFGGHALGTWDLVALEAVLAVVVLARWGRSPDDERLPLRWYLVAALPGLLLAGLAVAAVGGLTYPPAEDSLVHADAVRWFLAGNPAPPFQVDHLSAVVTPEVRFGFHAFAAALVRGTGLDPGKAVTAATWPVVLLMPGSLMLLARSAGMSWSGALLTGVAALGIGIIPFQFLALGNVPLITGAYVVAPAAAVAWCDALRVRTVAPVAVAVLLAGGLIFTHPSDLPTLALLTAVLLPVALRGFTRPTFVQLATVGAGVLALLGLLRIWTQYSGHAIAGPVYGSVVDSAVQSDQFFTPRHLHGFYDALSTDLAAFPHDWVLPVLALLGVVLAWRRLPARIFAVLGVALLLLQVDAWGWQVPASLLDKLYPWPSPSRLVGLDWFVIPPLAVMAVTTVVEHLRLRVRDGRRVRMLVASVAVAAATLPALAYAPGMLQRAHDAQTAITSADLAAFPQVERMVSTDSLVMTDGIADGGAWLPILAGRDTLLRKEWNHNSAATSVRQALAGLCSPGAGARLRAFGVGWVYLGPDPAASAATADRSCAASGTVDLRPVPLDGATANGPWLLRVEGG
jgi:hypothetical protein